MQKDNKHALITGASTGIGRALAIECAKKDINLALVSLPDSGLENLIQYLNKNYSVDIKHFTIDLTSENAPNEIYEWTKKEKLEIFMLINNAGRGHLGSFLNYSYDFYKNLIRLNVESVVLLTHLFLPDLEKKQESYIMNLGSIASYYPMPYKTVYASSKGFIYSFSRGLKEELKSSNVHVSILCPGPILTSQEVIHRIRCGGFWGKASSMRSQKMARIALEKLLKKKTIIIPGTVNKFFILINRIIPTTIKQKIISKKFNVDS
ncbi:MAG: SDR family NAD(P)-dependent oxidoreductase [Bacteroidales bacterium]